VRTWVTKTGYKIIRVLSGRSNVFLLTNGTRHILVDTSIKSNWNKLDQRLNDLQITSLDYLILTHTHFDHAANASGIKEKYNALVIVNKEEASYLATGDNIIPNGTNLVTRFLIYFFAKKVFPGLKYKPCEYDILADSILDLKDMGFNAYVVLTPGHTKGSMSVVIDDEIALVGDAMFGIFKGSILPPYANDVGQMIKSWGLLLEKTGCSLFIPAHGSENSRKLVQNCYNKSVKHGKHN
jgi:hydroxyacylglutathione hydrolase